MNAEPLPIRLKETLLYCATKSPYYKKLFQTNSLTPDQVNTLEQFKKIPLTTKEHLSLFGETFYVPELPVSEWVMTSGTQANSLKVPFSSEDLSRLEENEFLSLSSAGITSEDIVLLAVAMDRMFIAGLAYYLGLKKIGATVLRAGNQSIDLIINTLDRFPVTTIIGVPSLILKIASRLQELGKDPKKYRIKKIIGIGETIAFKDFSRNRLGSKIETIWNTKILSTYASTEMATSFCECPFQQGGHSLPNLIYTELLDEQGNHVSPGTPGKVVVTPLGIKGMPLLRYVTNDIAFMETRPCNCGYPYPRLSPILSRTSEMLKIKGTTVFVSSVLDHLTVMDEIKNCFMQIISEDGLSDQLKIKVSLKIPETEETSLQLQKKLQGIFRFTPQIEICSDDEILKNQNNFGSKKRMVIDLRKKQGVTHE